VTQTKSRLVARARGVGEGASRGHVVVVGRRRRRAGRTQEVADAAGGVEEGAANAVAAVARAEGLVVEGHTRRRKPGGEKAKRSGGQRLQEPLRARHHVQLQPVQATQHATNHGLHVVHQVAVAHEVGRQYFGVSEPCQLSSWVIQYCSSISPPACPPSCEWVQAAIWRNGACLSPNHNPRWLFLPRPFRSPS